MIFSDEQITKVMRLAASLKSSSAMVPYEGKMRWSLLPECLPLHIIDMSHKGIEKLKRENPATNLYSYSGPRRYHFRRNLDLPDRRWIMHLSETNGYGANYRMTGMHGDRDQMISDILEAVLRA